MIRSMTGYARAESQGAWGRLAWELRAVNHRYLDLQLKLPEELRSIENDCRSLAAAHVSRGKFECGLRLQRETQASERLDVDAARLAQVQQALQDISAALGPGPAPDPLRVLAYPGVARQQTADLAPLLLEALAVFRRALKDFNQTREREGERTAEYLRDRCTGLRGLVASVRQRHAEVRSGWLEKLRGRLRELAVEVEPTRLDQEMALALQRLDVDEEMARMLSHLAEVETTLARDDAIGRRLDFLMQELNREANTLSSKSQDAEMTRCAVEMKVLIEQMREQVQNLE